MEDLSLYLVETESERFYLVASDSKMDMFKLLAKSLGLSMKDPLPKPLNVQRLDGRVAGRVRP